MKVALLGLALASFTGCAHALVDGRGKAEAEAEAKGRHSLRGAVEVKGEARLVVAGPASHVHTSVNGGRPVSLFVVNAINGDDSDCATVSLRRTPVAAEAARRMRVPQGRELCAVSVGSTEVLWHAVGESSRVTAPLALQ